MSAVRRLAAAAYASLTIDSFCSEQADATALRHASADCENFAQSGYRPCNLWVK
jgi:hypothetical protein